MKSPRLIETRHTFVWMHAHVHTLAAPEHGALVRHMHNHHKYKLAIVAAGGGGGTEIEAD